MPDEKTSLEFGSPGPVLGSRASRADSGIVSPMVPAASRARSEGQLNVRGELGSPLAEPSTLNDSMLYDELDLGGSGFASTSSLPTNLPEIDPPKAPAAEQDEFDMSELVFDARANPLEFRGDADQGIPEAASQEAAPQASNPDVGHHAKETGRSPENQQMDSASSEAAAQTQETSLASPLASPLESPKASPRASHEASPKVSPSASPLHYSNKSPRDEKDTPGSPNEGHVSFADPPESKKPTHKKNASSSHFEYHQDAIGHVEKRRVYDESGEQVEAEDEGESSWQDMPTVGSHEMYDDRNNLVMDSYENAQDEEHQDAAASAYSRVANNDDAASITSLDDRTDYLFDHHTVDDDVDAGFQMAATKSMLTDQQKIAYAGMCRLCVAEMALAYSQLGSMSQKAVESLSVWGRDIVLALYQHLDLSMEEQTMIESLAVHNLVADDLTPILRQIQKVETNGHIVPEELSDEEEDVGAADLHEALPKLDKTVDVDVKWTVMCDLFLILLGRGNYDARSRTLLTLSADKLGVTAKEVAQFERKVTDVLQIDDEGEQDWTEEDIIEHRRRKALRKKYAYVGLATVGGGLVIGLSAGLLAPIVGAGLAGALGTIGISGTGGFLAGAGGTAIITTASTAIGMRVGQTSMMRRAGHVKTFDFRPIHNNNRVNVIITVGGWMVGKDDDVRLPFSTMDPVMGDLLSVHWEPEMMRSLGQTINILATEALAFGVQQILAATIMNALMTSLVAPMWLSKLSYLVDNPWSVSLDRAWAAGLILADTLVKRKLGNRPATLVGYGLGARMIYSCLSELARQQKFGLVQDVFIFGTPVFYQKKDFAKVRAMVSGRFVNGYSRKDWILAFLFPAAKRYGNVIGLDCLPEQETAAFHVENLDVSDEVDGHMNYRSKMPKLLKMCGFSVLSEEFDEIEDPDPEQLRDKQRKLLGELDTADKPKKSGFFSSWKFDWMQRAKSKAPASKSASEESSPGPGNGEEQDPPGGTMIFDVDMLRHELETLKPRLEYEQESMPLPEHDKSELPIELLEYDVEPVKPTAAIDYDDPQSPRPPPYSAHQNDLGPNDQRSSAAQQPSKVQLQFDDLE